MIDTPRPSRRDAIALAAATLALPGRALAEPAATALKPYGATPSKRQLAWHRMEQNAFVHFTINTFTDREWGYGDEDPAIFDPKEFDADQIVGAARAANLRGLIITAKHHDGFCLWPSAFTEHSVKNSPYKNGKGDIVGELAEACRCQGLKFGIYLSPWDRNHPDYGRPAYITFFRNQLRELLTRYGPIYEVFFDGANGGDGYYGGAREMRKIDAVPYYDWPSIIDFVHQLQPMACTFDPVGADLRWVGNEEGEAGDPCWATMDDQGFTPEKGNSGVRGGSVWWPAEADVSTRYGWFWHAYEDGQSRSPANLMKIYFETVGRSAGLLLNLAPDTRGRITDEDVGNLATFGKAVRDMYATDLARGATASASSARTGHPAAHVRDGKPDSFWAAADGAASPMLTLDLGGTKTFDVIRLAEHLPLGLRVDRFAIDIAQAGGWREIMAKQGIGSQRVVRLDAPVSARHVRLRIVAATAVPAITEFGVYLAPILLEPPQIVRDREGLVTLTSDAPGQAIAYTTDGSTPTAASSRYTAPFPLPDGGTVQAIGIHLASGAVSSVGRRDFDIRKSDWTILRASAPGAEKLIDELNRTDWVAPLVGADGKPCSVTIDLGRSVSIRGFVLKPGWHAPQGAGDPAAWTVRIGDAPALPGPVQETGEFSNIAANQAPQRLVFKRPHRGRYIEIAFPRTANGETRLAIAEIGLLTR
ncbi:alpha-L-fucosidase [uncultured Sphingomonas sp.]|uniref:alpha-L-fucosidase n=1 Tax=uncultured Sphingomonas sp. TaxID=158754 RepID=UPI0025EE99D4|nr:alpha-L-fucosidase [uncultured Sphingomonas sp.]